jgi:pantothenate kinase
VSTFRSVGSIAEYLAALPAEPRHRLVGIAGSPGAGKSTIAATLVGQLGSAVLLPMDGFHFSQAHLMDLGRRDRMGAVDTFDVESFLATIADLRGSDETVLAPWFDRETEEPVPNAIVINPEVETVIIEGNYLLFGSGGWENVAPQLNLTFFLESDSGVRQQRLIKRHVHFGKTPQAARAWVLGVDEPNARTVEATARRADHLIRLD